MAALNSSRMLTIVVFISVFLAGVTVGVAGAGMGRTSGQRDLRQQVDDGVRRIERAVALTSGQRAAFEPLVRRALIRRQEVMAAAVEEWMAVLAVFEHSGAALLEPAQRQPWLTFIAGERERAVRARPADVPPR